jgi:DNA polymerase-3 subunit beta
VLAEALGTVGRAVASRGGALPVLSGVRVELSGDRLRLTGSDLDLTISAEIDVNGEDDGVIVVPSKLASDVVRAVEEGAVEVVADGEEARITRGTSEFSLRLIPADEFPSLAELAADAVTVDAATLVGALKQVIPAASADDSRPILTGVLLAAEAEGLRLVATDSYRLAVRDLPGTQLMGEGQQVLVPSRALAEVARLLGDDTGELTIRLGERDASFEIADVQITTRLIEGEFPNYHGLIPSGHANTLAIGREPLMEAVRRVKLMAREATPVRLVMKDGELELIATTQDVGEAQDTVDAKYEGEELTVAFNPDYLLSGAEVSEGDQITIETIDSLKPVLIRSESGSDFLYLLMPVRVS